MDCSSPPSFGWSVNIVPGFVIRYSEYRMGLFYHIFDVERHDLNPTIFGRRSSASDQTAFAKLVCLCSWESRYSSPQIQQPASCGLRRNDQS